MTDDYSCRVRNGGTALPDLEQVVGAEYGEFLAAVGANPVTDLLATGAGISRLVAANAGYAVLGMAPASWNGSSARSDGVFASAADFFPG